MTHGGAWDQTSQLVQLNGLSIDLSRSLVTRPDGSTRTLTPLEHDLLSVLIEARGGVVTHEELGKRVWGWSCGYDDWSIRSCIKRLREKLQKPDAILNARSLGYRINWPRQRADTASEKN
jgi:DNA-binding response OmpR family regulator